MKAEEILKEVSKCKGIYGRAAKKCLNDKKSTELFLKECYWQIQRNPTHAKKTFGLEVCADIITFCNPAKES